LLKLNSSLGRIIRKENIYFLENKFSTQDSVSLT
jgi:hypothetical protein